MAEAQSTQPVTQQFTEEPLPANDLVEADTDGADSAYGSSIDASETQTINSSIFRGYYEHGRRYQNTRDEAFAFPSDDKQFQSMHANHMVYYILDSQQQNPLFRSPIKDAQNILDLGTGDGTWAIEVADAFPTATVHGVDLYPPPQTYVPPNCILEVDDISQEWTWNKRFDLVHMRTGLCSFTDAGWEELYARVYKNLAPGGWFEHLEPEIEIRCDDDTFPADATLRTINPYILRAAELAGKKADTCDHIKSRMEKAGFTNIQQKDYKCPIGAWPKHRVYKDAGIVKLAEFKAGMEGWTMFLLTKFGEPKPWSYEEVQVYVAKIRSELDRGWHIYEVARRVWAQKPYETETKQEEKVEVENVAETAA